MALRTTGLKPAPPLLLRTVTVTLAALLAGGDLVFSPRAQSGDDLPPGQANAPALPPQRRLAAPDSNAAELKKALPPKPAPEELRKQKLDALFAQLHDARNPEAAKHLALSVERLWLQSSSDTANLLMQRATASMKVQQYPLALSLLDKLVAWEPDWAEAWNQRATVKFIIGDSDGAMADIDQVLKLEPRHFGALTGMGMILQREGFDKRALEVFNQALVIYPLAPEIQKLVEKLTHEVEGRDI
jgi:tetratricopeptide (TPR) repeat protein